MGYISRIHLLVSKYFLKDCRIHHWSQNSHKSCLYQCNKPCDYLKPSTKSSSSKIVSENSLLGKLLMNYTCSIAPFTSNIIAFALNVSNCSTRAGSNPILARTYVLPFETVTNIVKREKTCSFCQKSEHLHVVKHSASAQLGGIKLTQ